MSFDKPQRSGSGALRKHSATTLGSPPGGAQQQDESDILKLSLSAALISHDGNLSNVKKEFIAKWTSEKFAAALGSTQCVKKSVEVDEIAVSLAMILTEGNHLDAKGSKERNTKYCIKGDILIILFDPTSLESIAEVPKSMAFAVAAKREELLKTIMKNSEDELSENVHAVCCLCECTTDENSAKPRQTKEIEHMLKAFGGKYVNTQTFVLDYKEKDKVIAKLNAVVKAGIIAHLAARPVRHITSLDKAAVGLQVISMRGKKLTDDSPVLHAFYRYKWDADLSKNNFVNCGGLAPAAGIMKLNLSHCKITEIAALTKLEYLVDLNLSNNMIKKLPDNMAGMTWLAVLDLSGNQLSSVDSLLQVPSLLTLNISDNAITFIPISFASMNLTTLITKGNPLVTPPKEVLKKGFLYVKMYLQGMLVGKKRWDTCKVVIVGAEGVGKTYLTKRLLNEDYDKNISTDGINVAHQAMKSEKSHRTINYAIFDFGGQEVFYPTHQFFLTGKCLYIVAFDVTNPQFERVEYWLRSIKWLGGISPKILIVGTHIDALPSEEALESVKKRLREMKNLVSIFSTIFVSSKTKKNIDKFKELVLEASLTLPILNSEVPESYVMASSIIQQMRKTKQFVPWKEFLAAFENLHFFNAQSPTEEIKVMAEFMNDIGIIGFYSTPPLNELVILDNQWLAEIMATIVSFKVRWKHGIVPHSAFAHLWKSLPDSLHDTVRALLERFEIIFPMKDENPPTRSVAPCMLPLSTDLEYVSFTAEAFPIKNKSLGEDRTRQIRRFNLGFLPLGLFARLIVRLVHEGNVKYKTAWLNGLIVDSKDENEVALLEYDDKNYVLTLTGIRPAVINPASRDIFGTIVFVIHSVINTFYSTSKDKMADVAICSHCLKKNDLEPATIEVEQLVTAFMKGHNSVTCPKDPTAAVYLADIAPDIALSKLPVIDRLEVIEQLASGGFGTVYLGRLTATDKDQIQAKYRDFSQECYLMSQMDHPHLVKLHGLLYDPLRLVMQFCGKQNLNNITTNPTLRSQLLNSTTYPKIAGQIASAMAYLHSLNPPLIHRDLRTPNIFVSSITSSDATVLVGDFGLSVHCASRVTEFLATFQWLAPEVWDVNSIGYNEKSDVYSFAMCLYEMLLGFGPFQNEPAFLKKKTSKIPLGEYMATKELLNSNGWRLTAEFEHLGYEDSLITQSLAATRDRLNSSASSSSAVIADIPTTPRGASASAADPATVVEIEREDFLEMELKTAIVKKNFRPTIPDTPLGGGLPGEDAFWRQLIADCWNGDANKRPSFSQIVQRLHTFVGTAATPDSPRRPAPTDSPAIAKRDLFKTTLHLSLVESSAAITDKIRKRARAEFELFDMNKSGMLNRKELKRLLRRLCRKRELPPPTKKDVAGALAVLDVDGDGQISFEEFLRWYANRPSDKPHKKRPD